MFQAVGVGIDGDHLDLSFRDVGGWSKVSADPGSPPSQWISLGDPVAGPALQLGVCPPVSSPLWLDTHYHASDQFRVVITGDFHIQRKHMIAGDFVYQIAGLPYREGLVPGAGDPLWMFAVHGDRRGARSTTTRSNGSFPLSDVGEDQLDRPVTSVDDPYWLSVPGGAKGQPALAVEEGRHVSGFSWGAFRESETWPSLVERQRSSVGLLGDPDVGPVMITLKVEAGATATPRARFPAETVLLPIAGEMLLADRSLCVGDVRIVAPGGDACGVAGPAGLELVLMISDRRAIQAAAADDAAGKAWVDELRSITERLSLSLTIPKQETGGALA